MERFDGGNIMTRKVKFLTDNVDLDLDVAVSAIGQIDMVEIVNDGIMFSRHIKQNNEDMQYLIPYSEEGILFEFID